MRSTALITGATGGIGYEFAKILAEQGHHLILVARDAVTLRVIQTQLKEKHQINVSVLPCDLSQLNAAAQVWQTLLEQNQQVDVLINNAGFGDFGLFVDTDWQRQAQMIQLNIVALTQLTHLCLSGMVQRRQGQILNVASTAAFQPGPYMSVYFASKAYVLSFTEAIADELKGTGVRVMALCPGPTASKFQSSAQMEHSRLVWGKALPTPAAVAEFGYQALSSDQVVAVHGWRNKLFVTLVRFLPREIVTRVVRHLQAPTSDSNQSK